jgi:signal transduction histidine kinase
MTARATQARAALAQLRSEFVATVTHELKTPIATIRAAGDTMARGRVSSPDALQEYVQLVVQESKRLARLVDNLLAYSRITDVTEAYAFTALDVSLLVHDVVAGFRAALDNGGFAVRIDLPPDLPPVRGDRTACLLLLDNLIDNAIRYSPSERWLDIRARAAAPFVTIEVADHGMGIPAPELPHVTRRFFRGQRSGSGGSGLGLAIASRIVRDHGGSIRIESKVDAGTTVSVTLPAAGTRNEETRSDR